MRYKDSGGSPKEVGIAPTSLFEQEWWITHACLWTREPTRIRRQLSEQRTRWEIDIRREQAQRTLGMQERLITFLMWAFGISLGVTLPSFITALFLTGWKAKTGFELSDKVLMFLGRATISEVAGLIVTAVAAYLKSPKE